MKENSIIAVIVVLMCFCLSCGSGDERIEKATGTLHIRYSKLLRYSKDPNTMRPPSTIYKHLSEVNDKQQTWQSWLREYTGYSLKKLNNPPGSIISEDELKVATEYHLFLSGWFYVRFMTLNTAANHVSHTGDWYPRKSKCREAASTAFKQSAYHKQLYSQYYQALDAEARQKVMKELKFPNYVDSEEQNNQHVRKDAISSVRLHLEKHLMLLLGRKTSMDLRAVISAKSIKIFLKPNRMSPNEKFLSNLDDFYPVDDFSELPGEAYSSDKEFMEIGWLLNRYRSLWYEIRHKEFLKFHRQKTDDLKADLVLKLEEAIEATDRIFQRFQSLSNEYYQRFEKFQQDRIEIGPNIPSTFGRQIHISEQCKGKRKRKTFKLVGRVVLQENHETAENQYVDEYLENVGSDSPMLDTPNGLKVASMEVNCQREDERIQRTKRHKCLKGDIQTEIYQSEQGKTSDEQTSRLAETKVFTIDAFDDSDLLFGANSGEAETGFAYDDMAMAHGRYTDELWDHQPCLRTTNVEAPLDTDRVTEVVQHQITQEVPREPSLEKGDSHDYRSTDDEFLEVLLHLASKNVNPSLSENFSSHILVTDSEGPSLASTVPVVHYQPDGSLLIAETQHEADAIEVKIQEESLCLNEIQEDEFLEFHSWLKDFLQPDVERQTLESSEPHEMTAFEQFEIFEAHTIQAQAKLSGYDLEY